MVALIARDERIIPPRGSTPILPGDHLFVLLSPETHALVDFLFRGGDEGLDRPCFGAEFPLEGTATVADLKDYYGLEIDAPADASLDQILREKLGRYPEVGDSVRTHSVDLRVREMIGDRIEWVGLSVVEECEADAPEEEQEADPVGGKHEADVP